MTLLLILVLAACSEDPNAGAITSNSNLDRYLDLPFEYDTINMEIVTLPEPGDTKVPGPTDYVALVAVISSDPQVRDAYVAALPQPRNTLGVPSQFSRPWFNDQQSEALRAVGAGNELARDASASLVRPANRALAVPSDESELVLYLEFVTPW